MVHALFLSVGDLVKVVNLKILSQYSFGMATIYSKGDPPLETYYGHAKQMDNSVTKEILNMTGINCIRWYDDMFWEYCAQAASGVRLCVIIGK